MMVGKGLRSARVRARALETSAIALAAMLAGPAFAQCAPDPTVANGTTTCTGNDTDGVRITTSGTTLAVAGGASVSNGGGPAVTVEIPNTSPSLSATITIAGQVTGGSQTGISLLSGPQAPIVGATTSLALTLSSGGILTGSTALSMARSAGNQIAQLVATVDNSGTITGTSGVALRGDVTRTDFGFTSSSSGFRSIDNRAGGVINGSIVGPVGTLVNAGLIDGGGMGAVSAGNAGTSVPFFITPGAWTNSGTIRSNGAAATIASSTIGSLTNTGTIANAGTGAALQSGSLIIRNSGQIGTAGAVAIAGTGLVDLINSGTITGNVVTGNGANRIDSSLGRINGSVTFGSGFDTLVVRYDGTATPVTGITGSIDGGGGTNTQSLAVGTDTTIGTPVALLAGFQRFGIATEAGVTTTLGSGFLAPATIIVQGAGTLINRAAITTQGTAFAFEGVPSPANQRFVNEGTIRTESADAFAITQFGFGLADITNSGSISSAGGGISAFQGIVTNTATGTITSVGTGVDASGARLTNAGTIRSTGGVGVQLQVGSGVTSTNSGSIEGVTIGAKIGGTLTNSGTITATGSGGTAVRLDPFGALLNETGGVVGSGGQAISGDGFNQRVVNAGTINGRVSLTANFGPSLDQRYVSQGGTLNGDLVLGSSGLLFTDLLNTGPGQFAGITGTVTAASGARLRYRVSGTQTATIGPVGPFQIAAYELVNDATLTLTAAGPITRRLILAGTGSVDLNADLQASVEAAVAVFPVLEPDPSNPAATGALAITSRGTITVDRAANAPQGLAGILLEQQDSFTNAGTIRVVNRDSNGLSTGIVAVIGGTVVNSGSINLDGGLGIFGGTVTNSGTIAQIDGGALARGVSGARSLDNSGTIRTGGNAVVASNQTRITNSGIIASTGGAAISGESTSATAAITNLAGGTITGTGGTAVRLFSATFSNAGAVTGTVDLGFGFPFFGQPPRRSFASSTYIADGGTIAGDLLFGDGADSLVSFGALGVSGRIDGGNGIDRLILARRTSDTITLGFAGIDNFEVTGVRALGPDTTVTVRADTPFEGDLELSGDGTIVNAATITGSAFVNNPGRFGPNGFEPGPLLVNFTNDGEIGNGFDGEVGSFVNRGTIGNAGLDDTAVSIGRSDALRFANAGLILNDGSEAAVSLESFNTGAIDAVNSGTITGRFEAFQYGFFSVPDVAPQPVSLANDGTISAGAGQGAAVTLFAQIGPNALGTVALANTGTIEATGPSGIAAELGVRRFDSVVGDRVVVTNSGTIRANGGGVRNGSSDPDRIALTVPAAGLMLTVGADDRSEVINAVAGTIEATGEQSVAVMVGLGSLDLTNDGVIRGGAGTELTPNDRLARVTGRAYLAGAVQGRGGDDRIVNSGTVIGSIDLAAGADRIDNLGRIEGNVFLGGGNDIFLQRASAMIAGTVDAGDDDDLFIVDATGGGAVNGDQFVNFERFAQVGEGSVAYSGTFRFDTVDVMGGTVTVGAGETLSSDGPVTISGSDAAETVVNDGTITGSVSLAGGSDRVVNRGTIGGSVLLGDGDDAFVEGLNSSVAGGTDGGAGIDTYTVVLAGDRIGIGARTGFEQLVVEGTGTLGLTLDQDFASVSLAGTGLNAVLDGFAIGSVTGSSAAERLMVDGDVAAVALDAGDDMLSLGTARAAGRYDGGAGTDMLRFAATGPVTLAGSATGFEQLSLASGALTVTGTLGAAGTALVIGEGSQTVTLAAGGMLAGAIDLGAGNDAFRFAAGGTLAGTVAGGAGSDAATVELAGALTLGAATLTGFETLATEGSGTLTLEGVQSFDEVTAATDLTVAAGGSLTARQVRFGAGEQRFTIAGGFVGSVDGDGGSDALQLSGGSAATPVAFSTIAGIESVAMTGGFATIAGNAALGSVDLIGGRLVGLAGSAITASQIQVRQGAIFGSAGTVTGNLTVAGTLSPGASPGTMTVNGNIALQSGSVSVFELTPTVQDKLVVNGAVSIASGATLQLVPTGTLQAGTSYDLITASGGISGSFSTVLKPDSLFGFVVQRADRIQLLGQFLADPAFSPQVSRSVVYANTVLAAQPASSPLFAALPSLLGANGASNPQAFAQLTPEAYASATQVGVENALALTDAARGPGFAVDRSEPGAFTFGQVMGSWYRLSGDRTEGVSAARSSSYGFLGGIGYGDRDWSVGAFGGYLDSDQRINGLGARTGTDGWVAGIHGRYSSGGLGIGTSAAYNAADAATRRALPGGTVAAGRYDLNSWVVDLSVHYAIDMGKWAVTPKAGITYVRTTRERATETGGVFALTVARDRHTAGFVDAGIGFGRNEASDAPFRPYVALGVRYQVEGERADAVAGYAGGPLGLVALGASRAEVVGTASAGLTYRLTGGLDLFATASAQTGSDDRRQAVSTGLRLKF